MHFIGKKNSITNLELAGKIGVHEKTIGRTIKELQSEGTILRDGSDKPYKWKITKMSV